MYNNIITLLENGPFIYHSIDEYGAIVHVSNSWLDFFGYNRDEVIGKKSTAFLDEESRRKATEEILPKFFEEGVCEAVDYVYVKKDGTKANIQLSAILVENSKDGKKYSVAVLTDVTEKLENLKELENHKDNLEELIRTRTEEMHTAMEMYRTLARTSPVAIMRTAASGACEFVNKKWTEITNQTKEHAKGDGWLNAVYDEDREKVRTLWMDAVNKRNNWTEEFRLVDNCGEISWVLCSGNVVNGKCGHVITFTNITKRKEILPQLLSLQKTMKNESTGRRSNANGG